MSSVIGRIREVNLGFSFIKLGEFKKEVLKSETPLRDVKEENLRGNLVGLAVDYLTRYMLNGEDSLQEAFKISICGGRMYERHFNVKVVDELLSHINSSLDDESITYAVKLVGFDVIYRMGYMYFKPIDEINPNAATISNIRLMVKQSLQFFRMYGPVTKEGFNFKGAYTDKITIGDGDFLTQDILWDFNVSKAVPTKEKVTQVIIYYILAKRSKQDIYNDISKVGIYNPRSNTVYILDMTKVDKKSIEAIERAYID